MLKRTFDFLLSFLGLITVFPLLLVMGAWIKLSSKGPIFYKGLRVGLGGETFNMYKFRTMVTNADLMGGPSTANDDPRITSVGKLLRKYKLDELPQLINIFKGEMSFVGPRPEVRQYTDLYTAEEKQILEVRPGITDWASLWNSDEGAILANSKDPEKDYLEKIRPKKLRLQLNYVQSRSFWIDLKIIASTAGLVFSRFLGREQAVPLEVRRG